MCCLLMVGHQTAEAEDFDDLFEEPEPEKECPEGTTLNADNECVEKKAEEPPAEDTEETEETEQLEEPEEDRPILESALSETSVKRVVVAVHAGAAVGNVDRSYDTRVGFWEDGESVFDVYEYDAFVSGTGAMFGLSLGYAYSPRMETSIYAGIVLGQQELSTGWEMQENGQIIDSSELEYDPVPLMSGHFEPRLKWYFLSGRPVRPYALAGGYIRIFDGYVVPDVYNNSGSVSVDYSDRPAGLHYGVTTGGGVVFQNTDGAGIFMEVPWTYILNSAVHERSRQLLLDVPQRPSPSSILTGVKIGMAFRF